MSFLVDLFDSVHVFFRLRFDGEFFIRGEGTTYVYEFFTFNAGLIFQRRCSPPYVDTGERTNRKRRRNWKLLFVYG